MIKVIRPQPTEDEEAKKAFDALLAAQNEIEEAVIKAQNKYKWNTRDYSDPIKEFLFGVYNGKCGFCEEELLPLKNEDKNHNNAFTIEHYRPKGYYWWLGNEWTNLFPLCKKCNGIKDNNFPLYSDRNKIFDRQVVLGKGMLNQTLPYFRMNCEYLKKEQPLFLHPEVDEPENYFSFKNGVECFEMKAKDNLENYETERVKKMLSLFLNVPNVRMNRKSFFDQLCTHLANSLENYFDNQHIEVSETNKLILVFGGFFKGLKASAEKDKRFSLFAKFLYENFIDTFVVYFEKEGLPTELIEKAYHLLKNE